MINLPDGWQKNVNYHFTQIDQCPVSILNTLFAQDNESIPLDIVQDVIGNCPYMHIGIAFTNDRIISVATAFFYVVNVYLLCLLFGQPFDDCCDKRVILQLISFSLSIQSRAKHHSLLLF